MPGYDYKDVESELIQAENARLRGNEGMARVCARRAAGMIIDIYLHKKGIVLGSPSAYDRLRYLQNLPDLPSELTPLIEHFLVRVTPDHRLPVDADLIAEAHLLKSLLLDVR